MNEVLKKLGEIGIIPVVVLDDAKDAAPKSHSALQPLQMSSVRWSQLIRRSS